jgi:Tol biopolymer transport system component/tRNA A-37 threonylcarbamoyl transferase component Bud32
MALTTGTKLGPYEILSPLGAGGMGEVYRARDTRLDRTVAIKVLNSQLIANAELRARFEREARIVSQLQHPHICVLHDVGSDGATEFLVMEYLEGESLANRLKRGPLPQAELLKIAIQIADALEKAHRAGVVHRDLKPGNVMLTKLGAKLLDFGLAKPVGATGATGVRGSGSASVLAAALTQTSPTATPATPLSTTGTMIGTVQYMSPEQIQGMEADARSDIFAFGAMLFEMATGKRTFEGKTQASIVGQILAVDPPSVSTVRPEVTPSLDRVIRLCLEKDPDERIQTAHDLRLNLQAISEEKPVQAVTQASHPTTLGRAVWIAAFGAALVLGALGALLLYHPAKPAPSIRASISPPPNSSFHLAGDYAGPPVVSPDGRLVAFTAASAGSRVELWVRPINSLEAHPIEGTTGATFPFWSPDSRSLGFFILGKLKKVDVNTGSPVDVTDLQQGRGGTWGAGGTIVFSPNPNSALMKVSAAGGTAEPLTKLDPESDSHRWPFFLPDGKHFLYLALNHDPSKSANDAIYYASIDGRENRLLFRSQSNAIYFNGFLLFARGDKLLAQSFDPAKGESKGEPEMVASPVTNDPSTWHMDASVAENGLLVYGSGVAGSAQLVWVDRTGKDVGLAADNVVLADVGLSPQGDRAALEMETGVGTADIFVLDLARGVRTRLTFGPVSNNSPRWSPDGKWIYYASLRNGRYSIFRKLADGSGAEESVLADEQDAAPGACSPDGKTLLFLRRASDVSKFGIWALPLAEGGNPSKVIDNGQYPVFSPDGRYVLYQSEESRRWEVYVVPFGDRKGKWQVSPSGGMLPSWSRDGKEIFYVSLEGGTKYSLVSVPVKQQGDGLQIGTPQVLISTMGGIPVYNVSADGKKILVERMSQQGSQSVTVVTNFAEGLKK